MADTLRACEALLCVAETPRLPIEERYISRNQLDVASAEKAAADLLEQPDPPTALFAANNRNTIGAYRAVREHHTTTDLAGFDDFELADMLALPLIVVSYDPRELGREAAGLLCERIDSRSRSHPIAPRQVVIPTNVVEYGAQS